MKHWESHCDNKFKYKEHKTLRDYLGLPPIKKPEGMEHLDDSYFAEKMDLLVDVGLNVPIVAKEELVSWKPGQVAKREINYIDLCVKWNKEKNENSEIYVDIKGTRVSLLKTQGTGMKFASKAMIEKAINDMQGILNDTDLEYLESRIKDKFGKSRLWKSVVDTMLMEKLLGN